jgi:hypothetical protein
MGHPGTGILCCYRRGGEGAHGVGQAPALEGIERLDGTLFVRVAGLTFDRLGWVDEGETAGRWDLDGIPMLGVHGEGKCAAQLLAHLV